MKHKKDATILTISLIYCWRRRRRPTDFIINNDEWTDF
ncbi:unnamed protein product [Paramecium sonneborni]|uniref:Uncharacterized protein n=1 Tax=Paramecium sonneborni TaxID=65129 RepID=A0A8S1R1C7_9CILI|nr:unnamed protein product [Paramecium sonneborni]